MNAFEKKLEEALRSGNYKQTTGALRVGKKFCCLGVACDIFNPEFWNKDDSTYGDNTFFYHSDGDFDNYGEEACLPDAVRSKLRWDSAGGECTFTTLDGSESSLMQFNDDGLTFDQIADLIKGGLIRKK